MHNKVISQNETMTMIYEAVVILTPAVFSSYCNKKIRLSGRGIQFCLAFFSFQRYSYTEVHLFPLIS